MGPEMKRYYGGWHYLIWDNGSKKGQEKPSCIFVLEGTKNVYGNECFFLKTGTVP